MWIKEYNKLNPKNPIVEDLTNTKLIKNEIKEKNIELFNKVSKQAGEEYMNKKIEKIYNKTIEDMERIIAQYLNYLNYDTDSLNFILEDMEFFTGDANYIKAHELFQNIYDLHIKIQEAARHFRYYKNGEGSKAVVLSEILKLQKNIFRVEENENSKIIYNEFSHMIELNLEEFRANIINNIKPDKIQVVPLLEIVKIKNKDEVKK